MLVYALVMAAITSVHTLQEEHDNLSFLIRALEECARCYKLAAEARSRLPRSFRPAIHASKTSLSTADSATDPTINAEGGNIRNTGLSPASNLEGLSIPRQVDPMDSFDALDIENAEGEPILDWNTFDLPAFDEMAGDFHGWFSIGQMG